MKNDLNSLLNPRHLPTAAILDIDKESYNPPGRSYWLALFMLLQISAATLASAAERPVVRDVLVYKEGNGARIEIKANQALAYRSYLMPGLEKWVIDLPDARTTFAGDESKKMRTAPLERITIRQKEVNGDHLTRIAFDFKGEVEFSLKEDLLDKGHLIVIIKPSPASPQTVAAGTSAPSVSKVLSELK